MSQSGPTIAPSGKDESPDSSTGLKQGPTSESAAASAPSGGLAARHRPDARRKAEAAADEHTLGAVRVRHVWVIVALAGLATVGLLLYVFRKFDFYYDEWDWLDRAGHWTPSDYFVPHGEHWSTVPMLVYKVLLSTVGMRSYLPFLAAMAVTHALGGMVVFAVLRKRGGDVLALALTVLFLLLGTGAEDLDWAFQIGFDASLLFGLLGVALLHGSEVGRWRRIGGCVALLLGLASSGIGLFYLAAAGVDALLQRDRWRRIWPVAVGLAAYVVWYEKFGKVGMSGDSPLSLHTLSGLVEYVPTGVATAVAGVFGLSASWGGLVLPLFIGAAVLLYLRFRPTDSLLWASAVGLVAQFVVTGMVRVQAGTAEATQNRYVTMAAPFVMIIIAVLCARLPQPRRAVPLMAIELVTLVALAGNLLALRTADHELLPAFKAQKQELAVVYLFGHAPGTDQNAIPDPGTAPTLTVADYLRTRKDFGGDVPVLTPASLGNVNDSYVNAAVHNIMPMHARRAAGMPENVGQCGTTGPNGGSEKLSVAGGRTVYITTSGHEQVTVQYWLDGPLAGYPGLQYWVPAGGTIEATLPQTGLGLSWHLVLSTIGAARICQG
jgi:hypothetical protein